MSYKILSYTDFFTILYVLHYYDTLNKTAKNVKMYVHLLYMPSSFSIIHQMYIHFWITKNWQKNRTGLYLLKRIKY